MKKYLCTLVLVYSCFVEHASAQYFISSHNIPPSSNGIYAFNPLTCEDCLLFTVENTVLFLDMYVEADGTVVFMSPSATGNATILTSYTPPSGTPTGTVTLSGTPYFLAVEQAPSGIVYLSGIGASIYSYDPMNGNQVLLGNLPAPYDIVTNLMWLNGELYAHAGNSNANSGIPPVLMLVNLSNPAASTIVQTPPLWFSDFFTSIPDASGAGFYSIDDADPGNGNDFRLYSYDPATNAQTELCDIEENWSGIYGYFPMPPATACLCITNAGQINGSAMIAACPDGVITAPPATQTALESNDLLRYILFSNLNDTLGSILATSNTPSFAFNPATMQTGETYYIAAIAGNNAGGNVDLNDPCLDISNAVQVTWRPFPTVSFSVSNPNICTGACTAVTADFTGVAPFILTYTTPASGTVTQSFSGNTGSFQVCTTVGGPPGSLVVQATRVVDAWCTCE
jgi:hypothetical protein